MNESSRISTSLALHYLEQAETYKKLGLKAQVRHELERARGLDPYIAQEERYKALLNDAMSKSQVDPELKVPLRIGAGMLLVNAIVTAIFLILILNSGGPSDINGGDIASPIVDVVVAVNLWQVKPHWKRYTVWWAIIGLVLFGIGSIATRDYFSLIVQVGFSGSLILLLAGTPSKARTIAAVAVFLVVYLGAICLLFALGFLGALAGGA